MSKPSEEWRPVVRYEGLYEVSNLGRVRSLRKWIDMHWNGDGCGYWKEGRTLAQVTDSVTGYHVVCLHNGNGQRNWTIHRLVLEAFVGPCPQGMLCRHFPDRDPTNNQLSNLQWGTYKENEADKVIHGTHIRCRGEQNGRSKLTNEQVVEIRKKYARGWTQWDLAVKYDVTQPCISMIVRNLGRKYG